MTAVIVRLGVAAAILCSASTGMAAEKASQKFLVNAIEGNLAEISMGRLAQQNGESAGVKSFGQQLVTDHGAANQRATAAAGALGVPPPAEPSKKQMADHDKMAKLTGQKFDRAFAKHMVADHKKDIAEYQKAAKMKDGDAASAYAQETLPTLQQHLQAAQALTKAK